MAPYFGCFTCEDTRKGLKAIDFDSDGEIDWNEFMVYIKWALRQYSDEIKTTELYYISRRSRGFNSFICVALRQ